MNKIGRVYFKIRYLDGIRLRNAVIASVGHLEQHLDYLNRINVFPVPDSDTGTNLVLTMQHISSVLNDIPNKSISDVCSQVAESALMGGQGNSGAILASYGKVSSQKKEDMRQQFQEAFPGTGVEKVGIVTDSSCDLPQDFIHRYHIHIIPVRLTFGTQTFLDKVQMTPGEFYNKLALSTELPTTSQPSVADARHIFDEVIPRYDRILSIHLPQVISGTLLAVKNAARQLEDDKITCIDGKNISAALGLVVMEAAEAVKEGLSFDKVVLRARKAIDNIRIFIILPTLKYLVRGGRISKSKGILGKILHLNPIVTIDREGHVVLATKAIGENRAIKKSMKIALKLTRRFKKIKFIIAHANAYAKARGLAAELAQRFDITDEIPIVEAAPALGVHSGPGTVGFAFIGYD